jgi:hypothetical protein
MLIECEPHEFPERAKSGSDGTRRNEKVSSKTSQRKFHSCVKRPFLSLGRLEMSRSSGYCINPRERNCLACSKRYRGRRARLGTCGAYPRRLSENERRRMAPKTGQNDSLQMIAYGAVFVLPVCATWLMICWMITTWTWMWRATSGTNSVTALPMGAVASDVA